jgi:hypothetical protein
VPSRRPGDPGGKLTAAARRWAGGRGEARRSEDSLTASAPPPAWRRAADEAIELAPDEADAFSLFRTLGTQWRHHAMTGMRLGIDYAAVEPTARMLGVTMTPALLLDLQLMEAAALDAWAEARR